MSELKCIWPVILTGERSKIILSPEYTSLISTVILNQPCKLPQSPSVTACKVRKLLQSYCLIQLYFFCLCIQLALNTVHML